jgi:hypothetical protein
MALDGCDCNALRTDLSVAVASAATRHCSMRVTDALASMLRAADFVFRSVTLALRETSVRA